MKQLREVYLMGAVILAAALGVVFISVGIYHFRGSAAVAAIAQHTGYSLRSYRLIGLAETAGGAGLLLGLAVTFLGVAAGAGLTLLMLGAVITHLRVGDGPKQWSASAVLAVLAAITTTLLATS